MCAFMKSYWNSQLTYSRIKFHSYIGIRLGPIYITPVYILKIQIQKYFFEFESRVIWISNYFKFKPNAHLKYEFESYANFWGFQFQRRLLKSGWKREPGGVWLIFSTTVLIFLWIHFLWVKLTVIIWDKLFLAPSVPWHGWILGVWGGGYEMLYEQTTKRRINRYIVRQKGTEVRNYSGPQLNISLIRFNRLILRRMRRSKSVEIWTRKTEVVHTELNIF